MALIAVVSGVACDQPAAPSAPGTPIDSPNNPTARADTGFNEMVSKRARFVDESEFPLVSSTAELDSGLYRFRLNGRAPASIIRDDYLITGDTTPVVRLVLHSSVTDGELTVETGPAHWSDVLRSGTYGVRLPLVPGTAAPTALDGTQLTVGPESQAIPNMEKIFPRTDVCALIDGLLADIPDSLGGALCGQPHTASFSVPDVITVTVGGTIDSLLILGGHIAVNGGVDLAISLDAGGLSGGRLPTFYPCNRRAYAGCITTPTGAALIDFLRKYAPSIPEASLPPVRVCIPGTPVRLRSGYWTWSGFTPHYHPPVYTRCSISDIGELPTITYPSITNVSSHIYPHIHGSLEMKANANGSVELEFPIPDMSVSAKYSKGSDSTSSGLKFTAEAQAGLFIDLAFTLKNAGAVVFASFNDSGVVTQTWNENDGWNGGYTRVTSERNAQFTKIPPDSAVFVFKTEVKAEAKLCLLICGGKDTTKADTTAADSTSYLGKKLLSLLKITADVGAALEKPIYLTWSRQVVDSANPSVDDWKYSVDAAYQIPLKAGLGFPGSKFIFPNVPTDWKKTITFDSVHMADMWGRGNLLVNATTTGTPAGTDPYSVTVARADTFPVVIASGATALRAGAATDHTAPLEMDIDPNGSTMFAGGRTPCTVFYSDAAFSGLPVAGSVVQGLRAHGVGVPDFAIPSFCKMLIARYTVTLGHVPSNCSVDSGAVRDSVWLDSRKRSIGRSDTTTINFNVTCGSAAGTGGLQLTTSATALPGYTAPYQLQIDSVPWGSLGPDTTVTIAGLTAGDHMLHFAGGPTNCIEIDSTAVAITAGVTATLTVSPPTCAVPEVQPPPPGEVAVSATTSGGNGDPSGYLVQWDGVTSASMGDNAVGKVEGVPASVPSVIQVIDIEPSCRPTIVNPFVVTLDAADDPITTSFPVTCTSSAIDTMSGAVESTALPTPSVALRASDGTAIALSGGPSAELAQLAGMAVTVWGVQSGTALDVYGYQIASTLDAPRWTGIVESRNGELWLFGAAAMQLVNPPPGLSAAVGAYVWVAGAQSGSAITPSAFGIIRAAP